MQGEYRVSTRRSPSEKKLVSERRGEQQRMEELVDEEGSTNE